MQTLAHDKAIEEIFQRHNQPLLAFLCKEFPDTQPEFREDIAQNAFVVLLENPDKYTPIDDTNFATWFYGVARNLALDQLKHRGHEREWMLS